MSSGQETEWAYSYSPGAYMKYINTDYDANADDNDRSNDDRAVDKWIRKSSSSVEA